MAGHALISGGSSGIGLALAKKLASGGWNVSILARDETRLASARSDIAAKTRNPAQRVLAFKADVADSSTTEEVVAAAIDASGAPSLLVASAGIVIPGLFGDIAPDAFRRTMEVNFFGTLHLIRAALPAMRRQRGSRIVLISSGAALLGLYGYTAYAPSKFAVRGLAESLRSELKPDGIAVSVVYPPDTDTPQLHGEAPLRPAALTKIAARARVLSADDVASAIMRGIAYNRFAIAPGWEMSTLLRLHSLVGPLLNRLALDRLAARWHGRR